MKVVDTYAVPPYKFVSYFGTGVHTTTREILPQRPKTRLGGAAAASFLQVSNEYSAAI